MRPLSVGLILASIALAKHERFEEHAAKIRSNIETKLSEAMTSSRRGGLTLKKPKPSLRDRLRTSQTSPKDSVRNCDEWSSTAAGESRRMAAEEGQWKPPSDGNYASWEALFTEELEKHCKHYEEQTKFEMEVHTHGKGLQQSTLDAFYNDDRYLKYEEYKEADDASIWFSSLAPWITLLVLGICVSIIACLYCFAGCIPSCRNNCWKKLCCDKRCYDRTRELAPMDLKCCSPWNVGCYTVTAVIALTCMLLSSIMCIVNAAHFGQGYSALSCDSWLAMKGHYFGTQIMNLTNKDSIVSDWKGTHQQWNEMNELACYTEPGEDNPVLHYMNTEYQQVYDDFTNGTRTYVDLLHEEIKGMESLLVQVPAIAELLGHGISDTRTSPSNDMFVFLDYIVIASLEEYAEELLETTAVGLDLLQDNIDKYVGPESVLLNDSYRSTQIALQTLTDVDYTAAGIVHILDVLFGGTLNAMFRTLQWISIIFGIVTLCAFIVGAYFYGWLGYAFWFDEERSNQKIIENKVLRDGMCGMMYLFASILAFSLLWSALAALTAQAGYDVCEFIDKSLYTHGKWTLLPPEMWEESLSGETDIIKSFDTCILREGDGDIAYHYGLERMLDDLEVTMDNVIEELRQLPDQLELNYKQYETIACRTVIEDGATLWIPHRDRSEMNYPDTRYIVPFVMPEHKRPRMYNCLVPIAGYGLKEEIFPSIFDMCAEDFVKVLYGIETLQARINTVTAAWDPDHGGFCMEEILETNPELCPLNYQEIIPAASGDDDDTVWDGLFGSIYADILIEDQDEAERYRDATYTSIQMQRFMNQLIYTFDCEDGTHDCLGDDRVWNHLYCKGLEEDVENPESCTVKEFQKFYLERMIWFGAELEDNIAFVIETTWNFLEVVTIGVMEGLLEFGRDALANFNCQYLGTSLDASVLEALCRSMLPDVYMTGLAFFIVFLSGWALVTVSWRAWHYLRDVADEVLGYRQQGSKDEEAGLTQMVTTASAAPEEMATMRSRSGAPSGGGAPETVAQQSTLLEE